MHEVIQDAEIEVHPDFVQNRLETGVERLAILPHYKGPLMARRLFAGSGATPGTRSYVCALISASSLPQ